MSDEKKIRKELLANQLELLIREMMDDYTEWRSKCGHFGWYNIPDEWMKKFFTRYIIDAAKKSISASGLSPKEENKIISETE